MVVPATEGFFILFDEVLRHEALVATVSQVPLGSQVGALRVAAQYLRIGWRMWRLLRAPLRASGARARAQRESGDRAIKAIHPSVRAETERSRRDNQKKWLSQNAYGQKK